MKLYLEENGMKTEFEHGELSISSDVEYGFRPFQLMVSAIASCSGMVFKKILEKQRINIDDLTINAEVVRNIDQANKIEKISLHFVVKGSDLNLDKLKRNLVIARKNCSMVRSVENSIEIEETIEVI